MESVQSISEFCLLERLTNHLGTYLAMLDQEVWLAQFDSRPGELYSPGWLCYVSASWDQDCGL
jgi:hypothetical protein